MEKFAAATRESGSFTARRKHQSEWMHAMIEEELRHRFFRNENVKSILHGIEKQVAGQTLPAATAVRRIMESFEMEIPGPAFRNEHGLHGLNGFSES